MENNNKETALVKREETEVLNGFNINPKSYQEAMEVCTMFSKTDFVPKDFIGKPGNIFIAISMGQELGLKPLQALQCIAVVNGRPIIYGDGLVAIVRGATNRNGERICEYIIDEYDEKTQTASCRVKRRGEKDEIAKTFSIADAKTAQLGNVHQKYPKRMVEWRAKSWALRAAFADALKGISVAEEFEFEKIVEAETVPPSSATIPKRLSEAKPTDPKTIAEPQIEATPEPEPEGRAERPAEPKQEETKDFSLEDAQPVDRTKLKLHSLKSKQTCMDCGQEIPSGEKAFIQVDPRIVVHEKVCVYVPQ